VSPGRSARPGHARALGLALSLVQLGGCAPVQLQKAQLAGARRMACAAADAPRVRVEKTVDARPDPETLGAIGGRAFGAADVAGWIDGELAALASPGFSVVPAGAAGEGARLLLRPRVAKAYVDTVHVTRTAVVVLNVDVAAPDGQTNYRTYRGQHAGMNWASSESSAADALREAAAACLEQLRADVEHTLHPSQPVPGACPPAGRGAAAAD
jgi:hypothetical protein